jgi:uncharacterized protein YkwD
MRRTLAFLFVGTALVAGTANAKPLDNRAPAGSASVVTVRDLQTELLAAINDLRSSKGLTELKLNNGLVLAALGHSQSMAKFGYFAHESHNGLPFWTRIRPHYRPLPGSTWGVGENLAWSSSGLSADEAVRMWLDSPPHRKNLLRPSWREIGLGAVHALAAPGVYEGLDVTIITADFGVR